MSHQKQASAFTSWLPHCVLIETRVRSRFGNFRKLISRALRFCFNLRSWTSMMLYYSLPPFFVVSFIGEVHAAGQLSPDPFDVTETEETVPKILTVQRSGDSLGTHKSHHHSSFLPSSTFNGGTLFGASPARGFTNLAKAPMTNAYTSSSHLNGPGSAI